MSLLFVAGIQFSLALGVVAAAWTEGLSMAPVVAVTGTLTGYALAKSRFNGPFSAFVAAVYGAFVVGLILLLQVPDAGSWLARVLSVVDRVVLFVGKALSGGTNRDSLIFVALVMTLTWAFGVASAWSLFRRSRFWQGVLPAGLALTVNVYYYNGPASLQSFVALYVLLVLLLLARTHLYQHELEWKAARVAFSPDMRFDFLRAGLVAAVVVLVAAWQVPASAASPSVASVWGRMNGPWNTVRENFVRLFSSLKAYGPSAVDYYGSSLVLSGSVELSDRNVLDVFVPRRGQLGRYYWRARVYNIYEDGRWSANDEEHRPFLPEEEAIHLLSYRDRRNVKFQVASHMSAMQALYVTGQPVWLSRPVDLEYTPGVAVPVDLLAVRAEPAVRRGEAYEMIASISTADKLSLRVAGQDYPEWVQARYLGLPATVTDRTRALALEITQGAATPYDKASAITDWLRDNIRYNQKIDAPPSNADPVDWFLFDYQQGYCNYYASAMVVMLRSLGIPARIAVGFAEGEYDSEAGAYRVKETGSHAWPEVFFPEYGWVEFEPTVSQRPIDRPEMPAAGSAGGGSASADGNGFDSEGSGGRRPGQEPDEGVFADEGVGAALTGSGSGAWVRWLAVALGLAATAMLAALAWWMAEYGEIASPARRALARGLRSIGLSLPGRYEGLLNGEAIQMSPVLLAYARLMRGARWLGLHLPAAFTPHERVEALASVLPLGREPAQVIADEYVVERFGRRSGDEQLVADAWTDLRLKVWGTSVKRRLLKALRINPPSPDRRWAELQTKFK